MTEYTPEKVADLIAVALTWNPTECAASPVGAWHTIERLADALEALSAERDAAVRDLDAGFTESDHLSAKYYQRMRDAEREMHARELHHFEEEKLRAEAEAERDGLTREMHAIDAELDRARANGTVYTYGNIQHRIRVALSRIPEHPKED